MKFASANKLPLFVVSTVITLVFSLLPLGRAYAACTTDATACRPWFKSFGADVFAGGWFMDFTTNSCPTAAGSNYQDASYNASTHNYGGIITYANKDASGNAAGGASSQYGAFALGNIVSASAGHGFYSGGAQAAAQLTVKHYATFGNSPAILARSSTWGGFFQDAVGSGRQPHCIPDYWSEKLPIPVPGGLPLDTLTSNLASGVYKEVPPRATIYQRTHAYPLNNGGPVTISACPNPPTCTAQQITIFVAGSIYIKNNITYSSTGQTDTNVPKFALVVKGNIYIDPTVTQLDGLYISQPTHPNDSGSPAADDGVIWTCHDDNFAAPTADWVRICDKRLLINGAVIVKQINFLRFNVATPRSTSEDQTCGNAVANNVSLVGTGMTICQGSEIINYSPEMVLGSPFFNPPSSGTTATVQSLISLPPSF